MKKKIGFILFILWLLLTAMHLPSSAWHTLDKHGMQGDARDVIIENSFSTR
jgi:hypothetical protein